MMVNGSSFMVGNVVPYIYSYFDDVTQQETQILLPMIMFFTPMMNYVGANLAKSELISTKQQILLGIAICAGGVYLSSLCCCYLYFMILFTTSFGFGTGLIYSCVLYKAWLYFPGKEGVISGTIIAGFGIGGFMSITLSQRWLNPENVQPHIGHQDGASIKPYDMSVAQNLPLMLRNTSYAWLAIGVTASLLFQDISLEEQESLVYPTEHKESRGTEPTDPKFNSYDSYSSHSYTMSNSVSKGAESSYDDESMSEF